MLFNGQIEKIKNNKAELYDNHVRNTSVGDTIEIDTNEKTIKNS